MQASDLSQFLADCISQLDLRLKEFKAKAEANKKKKGTSKNDASRRSADQVDEHKKMLQRLSKQVQRDPQFETEHVLSNHLGGCYQRAQREP